MPSSSTWQTCHRSTTSQRVFVSQPGQSPRTTEVSRHRPPVGHNTPDALPTHHDPAHHVHPAPPHIPCRRCPNAHPRRQNPHHLNLRRPPQSRPAARITSALLILRTSRPRPRPQQRPSALTAGPGKLAPGPGDWNTATGPVPRRLEHSNRRPAPGTPPPWCPPADPSTPGCGHQRQRSRLPTP